MQKKIGRCRRNPAPVLSMDELKTLMLGWNPATSKPVPYTVGYAPDISEEETTGAATGIADAEDLSGAKAAESKNAAGAEASETDTAADPEAVISADADAAEDPCDAETPAAETATTSDAPEENKAVNSSTTG